MKWWINCPNFIFKEKNNKLMENVKKKLLQLKNSISINYQGFNNYLPVFFLGASYFQSSLVLLTCSESIYHKSGFCWLFCYIFCKTFFWTDTIFSKILASCFSCHDFLIYEQATSVCSFFWTKFQKESPTCNSNMFLLFTIIYL